jgi:hypothetical protein
VNAIIDQQRFPPVRRRHAVGDRVASRSIGRCAAFVGTVESYVEAGYNVRASDDGGLWFREDCDLTAVNLLLS